VYNGEWYDFQFANFAIDDTEDAIFIRKQLLDPIHTVSETGETYRIINYWDTNGLLFENVGRDNRWRKFSHTELVWIYCLGELRGLGVSIATLKKLRDNLFYVYPKEGKTFSALDLAFFITRVIGKNDVILIVDSEGRGNFCLVADYQNSQIIKPLPTSYVVVSLNAVYGKFRKKSEYFRKNTPLFVLSEKEQEMLWKIGFEEKTEMNVKAKDGVITRIDYKTKKVNPKNAVDEVREMLKDGARKEIVLKQENGKVVMIERTDKT
jgi:hypothetical protein